MAHRDIKPDNIFLDENFNLVLADFGFAAPLAGKEKDGFLKTRLGTEGYMAPEIHESKSYSGSQVDAFAMGCVLFILVMQITPFKVADVRRDIYYRTIKNNNSAAFWKCMEKARKKINPEALPLSEDFKNLVISLLQYDPNNRPSISEVLYHSWFKLETATPEEVIDEFKQRKQAVEKKWQEDLETKQKMREAFMEQFNPVNNRGGRGMTKNVNVYVPNN